MAGGRQKKRTQNRMLKTLKCFKKRSPIHQCDRQQDSEQGDVMQHQQELPADEGVHGPQRMLLVVLMPFDAEAVVVTEVHGKDVIRHVGHTIPDDKVGGQPVPEDETEQKHK